MTALKPSRSDSTAERESDVCALAEKLYVHKFADVSGHETRAEHAFKAAEAFIAMRDARKRGR